MAAELEHLIERYRQHGLTQAATALSAVKEGLCVLGQLPPALPEPPPDLPSSPVSPAPPCRQRRVFSWERGRFQLQGAPDRFEPGVWHLYEDDALGLSRRHHNALVRAGIVTIEDLQAAAERGALRLITGIGPKGIEEITTRLQAYRASRNDAGSRRRADSASDPTGTT